MFVPVDTCSDPKEYISRCMNDKLSTDYCVSLYPERLAFYERDPEKSRLSHPRLSSSSCDEPAAVYFGGKEVCNFRLLREQFSRQS